MPYQIKPYTFQKAKTFGLNVMPSSRRYKKLDVFDDKMTYITSVGDSRFSDYPTYLETMGEEFANKRRELYHIRHRKDNKAAGKLARILLW